jgi:UDP-galactopyranose mutase
VSIPQTPRDTTFAVPKPALGGPSDVITFSHLRWDFVFQRPQHLMSRFAKTRRVFFVEEPILHDAPFTPLLRVSRCEKTGVIVLVPHVARGLSRFATEEAQKTLLNQFCQENAIKRPIAWYYTPELYGYSKTLETAAIIYDCMDELANFRFASEQLPLLERDLMRHADLVFTGGRSLYEAKHALHPEVHCFPSSVDREHFSAARETKVFAPADQANIPHPRLGYYGVIDERMDFGLITAVAEAKPDWNIVLVGPVAKVSADELSQARNIHYLGGKTYQELPQYLAGWDVALMPFAINEATRFISPTKTPEYLAGGKPVVSTPITDVVRQYGKLKGVKIAHTPSGFVGCCEDALALQSDSTWLAEADAILGDLSWDRTFGRMNALIERVLSKRARAPSSLSYHAESMQDRELRIEH